MFILNNNINLYKAMEKVNYEMFSKAGERACQSLVNKITKKIFGNTRVTEDIIEKMIDIGMDKISIKHSEVGDSEPRWHIRYEVNKALEENFYSFTI